MVYCLFEQSGTFKNFFQSKGYEAIDVDLEFYDLYLKGVL